MKKLIVVLIAAFSIITACMIYLIRNGVSLRLSRVIEPTLMSVDKSDIARGLVSRLTPAFQPSKYVVFGIDKEDQQVSQLIKSLQAEFLRDFKTSPQIIDSEADFVTKCEAQCWILASQDESTHLQPSKLIERLKSTGQAYFTISFLRFDRKAEVPAQCETQKRISIECVTPLAVREARRKLKESSPYFFVRNYNEKDYFLFLEN